MTTARPAPAPARARTRRLAAAAAGLLAATSLSTVPTASADEHATYAVLVVGETLGFRHSHIDETTRAVIDLGEEHGFTVDVWDPPNDSGGWWGPGSPGQPELTMDSTPFTSAEDLAQYATIVFASPVDNTNDLDPTRPTLLDDDELAAFQGYIRAGGGYVGLHAATDSMHTIDWYSDLTGGDARFAGHPQQQTAVMRVEDPTHPSTEMLPLAWERFDEWYNFTTNPREDVHVLITLDESTYDPGSGAMGADHPLAWCHNFEGGRSWYEGAGHVDESYADPLFLAHLLGGIEWTAGVAGSAADCITFGEVLDQLASHDDASRRAQVLLERVTERVEAAHAAELSGDRTAAVRHLRPARAIARALDHDLGASLHALLEWQRSAADATS